MNNGSKQTKNIYILKHLNEPNIRKTKDFFELARILKCYKEDLQALFPSVLLTANQHCASSTPKPL